MPNYVTFLRGVNVGGKAIMNMADLRQALSDDGFTDVTTYIQSGNVIFTSSSTDRSELITSISACIQKRYGIVVTVALFTSKEWQSVIAKAPNWWGKDQDWKHNILIIVGQQTSPEVLQTMGDPKLGIDLFEAGEGVVYQSVLLQAFGRSTSGKLVANPVYKHLTIRNFNTATKIAQLVTV